MLPLNHQLKKCGILLLQKDFCYLPYLKGDLEAAGYEYVTQLNNIDHVLKILVAEFFRYYVLIADIESPRSFAHSLTLAMSFEVKYAFSVIPVSPELQTREQSDYIEKIDKEMFISSPLVFENGLKRNLDIVAAVLNFLFIRRQESCCD